jgi:hypothetical protein
MSNELQEQCKKKHIILFVGDPLLLVNHRCMSNDEGCDSIEFFTIAHHPKVIFVDCLNNAFIEII